MPFSKVIIAYSIHFQGLVAWKLCGGEAGKGLTPCHWLRVVVGCCCAGETSCMDEASRAIVHRYGGGDWLIDLEKNNSNKGNWWFLFEDFVACQDTEVCLDEHSTHFYTTPFLDSATVAVQCCVKGLAQLPAQRFTSATFFFFMPHFVSVLLPLLDFYNTIYKCVLCVHFISSVVFSAVIVLVCML